MVSGRPAGIRTQTPNQSSLYTYFLQNIAPIYFFYSNSAYRCHFACWILYVRGFEYRLYKFLSKATRYDSSTLVEQLRCLGSFGCWYRNRLSLEPMGST